MGVQAGQANTTGSGNFIMGTNAGRSNTTGSGNFFLGDNTGGGNTTGGFNVYLGTNSGDGLGVNGDNNVAIGFESGRGNIGGVNNTFIGFRADAGQPNLVNATAIGYQARVSRSESIILGNQANVGIGNSAPTTRLHITSGTSRGSGLRLENLTASSNADISTNKFLTVDATGNVILAFYSSGGREAANESLWQRSGRFLQSSQDNGVVIGQNVGKRPAGYKLFVEGGILTEKVKVAVNNTDEWSDYVFAPGYKLPTLAEVERHIQKKGHLPGMPSAQQMVEQGNDLHHTDAKLLEKIEELTLYSIEQQKRIAKLERMLEELLQNKQGDK